MITLRNHTYCIQQRFFREAGFFHDEIDFPEGGNDISDKTVWKAAIKRGQTRTRSQYAEHKQVRQCQACLQAGLLLIALRTR